MTRIGCLLAGVLLALSASDIAVQAQSNKEETRSAQPTRVKVAIAKLGTGEDARAAVALADGSIHSGYVMEAGDDSFLLVNPALDTRLLVEYQEVKQLRAENVHTGVKISVPGEGSAALKAVKRIVTFGKTGRDNGEDPGNHFLSKTAVVVLVVLGVALILIGVELGKS